MLAAMSTPSRKRPPKSPCLICFSTKADSCNYGSIPGWCRQCQSTPSFRNGIFRSLFSQVPMAFASRIFQARTRCPLEIDTRQHNILEFRTPYVEIGTGTHTLNITGDLSSTCPSHRAQMDQVVKDIYPANILCKKPPAKLLATALMLRSYLGACSESIFTTRPMYSPENYHNSDNGFESDLCIQVFYFCLGRIDEILSEVFAACSKDLKAGTEEYWGSVTAAVAVTYSGMTKLQQDLGHGDLKTFYGVEESHELVAHLQYQIQTSTERLLLLLREQGLGCDNQWHEYFEDVSQLRGASNYPTVIMTLKNRQTSEAYDGSNSVLNNITVGWEPHAEGALLPDLESNLDASMNTPGSSTHSDGPQNAINLQSPYPISNMLSTNTRSYDSPVQQDNGTNSFSGTSLGSYRGIAAECASSSQQNQSYNSQYIWPYIQSEASPNIQYPNLNNWNNSSHYESIDMGQPAPGGFSLDLNTPPRPEELSSMMSSSADPITNPAYSQQSLGTMPYFSGHPHELSPGWPFYF